MCIDNFVILCAPFVFLVVQAFLPQRHKELHKAHEVFCVSLCA
jgi:hypothetical protein